LFLSFHEHILPRPRRRGMRSPSDSGLGVCPTEAYPGAREGADFSRKLWAPERFAPWCAGLQKCLAPPRQVARVWPLFSTCNGGFFALNQN
jgi:hypothetical protein